jgi:Phosphotransferase enzyme family
MTDDTAGWDQAEVRARTALAARAATAALAGAQFMPIAGSVSNFAWHAVVGATQCFVRLARDGSESLGADLEAEAEVLVLVAAAGLAPEVVRCDPASRLLVTRWIEPQAAPLDLLAPRSLEQVAAAMARLHRMQTPGVRHVNFEEQARLLESGLPTSAIRAELGAAARAAFGLLDRGEALALCHHDLHAQNVVVDATGRPWFVDWE